MTTAGGKLAGTCSVCLRSMQLGRGDRPIRHGFTAVGVHHGQSGGYHTGPCQGTGFPHLGISTAGTQWAIINAREQLARTDDQLRELATHPDLIWYPRKRGSYNQVRGGLPDLAQPVTLRHGEAEGFAVDGRPTYAAEQRRRVGELTNIKDSLESAISAYQRVLAGWTPAKYPTSHAPGKVETVHMATPRQHARLGAWTGIRCRFTKPGYPSDQQQKTTDPSLVTCKRCRAALGLPAL